LVEYAGDTVLTLIVKPDQVAEINFGVGAQNDKEDSFHSFSGPFNHSMHSLRGLLGAIDHRDETDAQALHHPDPTFENGLSQNWPRRSPQARPRSGTVEVA